MSSTLRNDVVEHNVLRCMFNVRKVLRYEFGVRKVLRYAFDKGQRAEI